MERLIEVLTDCLREVERIGESRSMHRSTNLSACVWRDDPALHHNTRQLKAMSEGLGAQCTKLALLALRSPTEEYFESLFSEIIPQAQAFKIQFINFSNCSLSLPLLLIVCLPVRHFLKRMLELSESIKAGAYEDVSSITAKVHECAEAVKKVPETNKIAYKRAMMDKVAAINDVINEFAKHVAIYNNKYGDNADTNNEDNRNRVDESFDNDGDGDSGGGEEEEGEYTAEEVMVAEKCLKLISHARDMLKVGISVSSAVADALHPLREETQETDETPASVFSSPTSSSEQRQCQEWVAKVLRETEVIETSVVDVGSELYDPLDNPGDVRKYYNTLFGNCASYLQLVSGGNSRDMLGEETGAALDRVSRAHCDEFEEWSEQ